MLQIFKLPNEIRQKANPKICSSFSKYTSHKNLKTQ